MVLPLEIQIKSRFYVKLNIFHEVEKQAGFTNEEQSTRQTVTKFQICS